MTSSSLVGNRRGRTRRRLALCAVTAAAGLAVGAPTALAGTHTYCSGCQIPDYQGIQDPSTLYLTDSYVHWLGTSGSRYLGASAVGFGVVYGYNEAFHPFDGSHYAAAQAANASGYSVVTVNAHTDY